MLGQVGADCLVRLPTVEISDMMVETVLGTITDMIPMVPRVLS